MACYQTAQHLHFAVPRCPAAEVTPPHPTLGARLKVPSPSLKRLRAFAHGRPHVARSHRPRSRPKKFETRCQVGIGASWTEGLNEGGWTTFNFQSSELLGGDERTSRGPTKTTDKRTSADRDMQSRSPVHTTADATLVNRDTHPPSESVPLQRDETQIPVAKEPSPPPEKAPAPEVRSQLDGTSAGAETVAASEVRFQLEGTSAGAETGKPEARADVKEMLSAKSEEPRGEPSPAGGGGGGSGPAGWMNTYRQESTRMADQIKAYGLAGVLSYGIFNTLYYLVSFLFVWFYVAPSPGGLGFSASATRFGKLFAMVWAGSQVTKLIRAGCALALAPLVDKALNFLTERYNFKSRGQAFGAIVGACFSLAFAVFIVITTLWA